MMPKFRCRRRKETGTKYCNGHLFYFMLVKARRFFYVILNGLLSFSSLNFMYSNFYCCAHCTLSVKSFSVSFKSFSVLVIDIRGVTDSTSSMSFPVLHKDFGFC